MSSTGFMTLAEAGTVLGVGVEQVRRYIHRGLLPAAKTANIWLVPAEQVRGFKHCRPRRGRPLSERVAWEQILAGRVDLDDPHRYDSRGAVSRWHATPGMVADLLDRGDIVVGGSRAAKTHGALLDPPADAAHVYVAEASITRPDSADSPVCGFTPDRLGPVVVRAVTGGSWRLLRDASRPAGAALHAPPAVAALDLATSPHPREQHAAETLLAPRP